MIARLTSLPLLLLLAGCGQEFNQPVNYIARIYIGDLGRNSQGEADTLNEFKHQKINLCFQTSSGDRCINNVGTGDVIQLRTTSKSLGVSSVEILGQDASKHAFKKSSIPTLELPKHADNVYVGRILVHVSKEPNQKKPEISIFATCSSRTAQMDLKPVNIKNGVSMHCFEIGDSFTFPKGPVSIMPVMDVVN